MQPREVLGERDTDRTHGEMDRALGQTVDDTARAQGDVGCRVIVRQHRNHRIAAARSCNIGRLVRTEHDERAALSATAIEYRHLVPGLDEVGRHRRAHVPESDKSYFHILISMRGWRFRDVAGAP